MTKYICEWCNPTELGTLIVADHPEKCKVIRCKECHCRTWHYPEWEEHNELPSV